MPVCRLFLEEMNLVVLRIHGVLYYEEMIEAREKLLNMEGFHSRINTIRQWDVDVDLSHVSNDEVQRFSQGMKIFDKSTHHVIVAPDALSYGLSRIMVANRFSEDSSYVVRTLMEACQILGIDPDELNRSTMAKGIGVTPAGESD